jgi:hypothetical protein
MSDSDGTDRPLLRIVAGGEPTAEEVAALVAAVASLTTDTEQTREANISRWADRAAALRRPPHPGPGAWRASARRM